MSAVQNLFQQAQLAEAAYANFINPDTGTIYNTDAGIQAALIASGFSSDPNNPAQSAQATDFVTNWRVVDQCLNEIESGFSATLFESVDSPGQYTLAMRGTNEWIGDDGEADVDVTFGGAAFNQLLSMVNYVLRLQAGSIRHYPASRTAGSRTSRTGSGLHNCIKMFSQSFGDCDGTARSLLKPGHQVAYG
jgi:hypothetical protein